MKFLEGSSQINEEKWQKARGGILRCTMYGRPPFHCLRHLLIHRLYLNPLNAELNHICHLLALLGAHHILHVSMVRVNTVRFLHLRPEHCCRHKISQQAQAVRGRC